VVRDHLHEPERRRPGNADRLAGFRDPDRSLLAEQAEQPQRVVH
jgi:hypothetical protein